MDDVLGILVVRQNRRAITMVDMDVTFIFIIFVDPVAEFQAVKSLFRIRVQIAKRLKWVG